MADFSPLTSNGKVKIRTKICRKSLFLGMDLQKKKHCRLFFGYAVENPQRIRPVERSLTVFILEASFNAVLVYSPQDILETIEIVKQG